MNNNNNTLYWGRLVKSVRESLRLSQQQFADYLKTDQGTISRWERGVTTPGYETRQTLDQLAQRAGLATLDDVAAIVRFSPFPMILVDENLHVVAASAASDLEAGKGVTEQTPENERGFFEAFSRYVSQQGFWQRQCEKLDYEFTHDGIARKAVLTPVYMRGEIYALVQKA